MAGEDLSTSEDEDGVKKSGYELTDLMKEFNDKTNDDYTEGYDPRKLDEDYKNLKHYDKEKSDLPKAFSLDLN